MGILENIRSRALSTPRRIALGDARDERILRAAYQATREGIAEIVLVGNPAILKGEAERAEISIDGIEITSPATCPVLDKLAASYYERRKGKLHSLDEVRDQLRSNELLFGAAVVASGYIDGMVAGSLSTTGNVIRAAIHGIGLAPDVSVLSSMFLLAFPPIAGMREKEFSLAFADAAVVPDPTAQQLADIAIATAETYRALTEKTPYIAMLSFSTLGSARSASTEKVIEATTLARAKAPELLIDGELQFDAAFVQSVAERKAPSSPVAGKANVFIFPNLDAGNIGYKIAERLGIGQAIGPVLQGLRRPMNDLSRGASVSDIVNMIAITALQA